MNDPNGPLLVDGVYHLFYQYNPSGTDWGNISWGHATSTDLLRWTELPVAIPADGGTLIFSGSAVRDREGSSGLCRGADCLVAIYTAHRIDPETQVPVQAQALAFSADRGATWSQAPGNPVLDERLADFRDPNVFWHEPSARWIMPVALASERRIRFYTSQDLHAWERVGEFGPAGATDGIWECPTLVELPVDGQPGERRWLLKVDVNPGAPAGGSGGQYWVGRFDGTSFTPDEAGPAPRWLDAGWDFYCALQFSGEPDGPQGRTWIAWMSNWAYAATLPTEPWRGAMTLPRRVALSASDSGYRLVQEPLGSLASLRREPRELAPGASAEHGIAIDPPADGALEIEATLERGAPETTLLIQFGPDHDVAVAWRPDEGTLNLDRSRSGIPFWGDLPATATAELTDHRGSLDLRIIVDRSSIEVFADGGRAVLTALVLPPAGVSAVSLDGGPQSTLRVHRLIP